MLLTLTNASVFTWITLLLIMALSTASAEDVFCMNTRAQQVSINTAESNPYKIMTRLKDKSGYSQNQRCIWTIVIDNFQHTVQLLINVTTVDFAFVDIVNEQSCNNRSGIDRLSMRFNGEIRVGSLQFSYIDWCSNWMALRTGEILVFSMMSRTSSLSVQFQSAPRQNPLDNIGEAFRGVEFNVIALKANFCEHGLLYHRGWCYFITNRLVTFRQAWNASHHATGELVAFESPQEFAELLEANKQQASSFPHNTPLDLNKNKLVWVGNFKGSDGNVYLTTSVRRCLDSPTIGFVKVKHQVRQSSEKPCRFALNTSSVNLTCQDDAILLPALIRFPLLSAANLYEAMAYPCPPPRDAHLSDGLAINKGAKYFNTGYTSSLSKQYQILISGLCLLVAVFATILALLTVKCVRDGATPTSRAVMSSEDPLL